MIDEETVSNIIEFEFDKDTSDLRKNTVGRAHESFLFTVGSERYFLKVADDVRREDRFQVEAPVNKLLSKGSNVSVPDIIGFDNSKSVFDVMYFVSSFEEGVNLDTFESEGGPKFPYLSEERKKRVLRSAGRQLGMLHSQTGFDSFGFFKGENNCLEFGKRSDNWKKIFREIIIGEQLSNFPSRFKDLESLVRDFVDENIDVLDSVENPCVIHQDFRWPNVKVQGDKLSTVFDWERAVSGHCLYDFTKAEKSLLQFKTERSKDKYRECLLDGYREHMDMENGWRRRKRFYRALRPVEALWSFDGWTEEMDEETKEEMAKAKREELREGIRSYRKRYN